MIQRFSHPDPFLWGFTDVFTTLCSSPLSALNQRVGMPQTLGPDSMMAHLQGQLDWIARPLGTFVKMLSFRLNGG